MGQKRGICVLVLVLLAVLIPYNSFAEERDIFTKYTHVMSDVGEAEGCGDDSDHWSTMEKVDCKDTDTSFDYDGYCGSDCDEDGCFFSFPPSQGCAYIITEDDHFGDDDDGAAEIKPGEIISVEGNKLQVASYRDGEDNENDWDDGFKDCGTKWKSGNTRELLCGDNFYWYECDEQRKGKIIEFAPEGEALAERFICVESEGKYKWGKLGELGENLDKDFDGVPDSFDCAPDNLNVHPSFACPEVKDPETGEGVLDCNALGAVPVAVEICGDGIDNDCSDTPAGDIEIRRGDEVHQAGDITINWIEGEGNNCCGDDITDLGTTITADSGQYLCLNSQQTHVADGDIKSIEWGAEINSETKETTCSNSEWCWISALYDFQA